jgi:hypothetical protein
MISKRTAAVAWVLVRVDQSAGSRRRDAVP